MINVMIKKRIIVITIIIDYLEFAYEMLACVCARA